MALPAKFTEKQLVSWLASTLVLIAAASLLLPQHFDLGLAQYLPLHTAMETFSIVVAMLTFAAGINSYKKRATANLALLSSAFLAVGLLDFGHTLSYAGMPDFVTASGPEKGIYFWLAARMVAALALLAAAVLPWQKEMAARAQAGFLAAALGLSATLYWIILFHQDALPRVFDPATGLTPLKRNMEYLLVGIYAATAIVFHRHRRDPQPYDVNLLLAAVAVMGLSELFFASYTTVADTQSMLGHVYKIIAYYLLYRAIFAQAIRAPYLQLVESERSLRYSEARFHTIFDSAGDAIFVHSLDTGAIVDVNRRACEMYGYAHEEMLNIEMESLSSGSPPYTQENALRWLAQAASGKEQRLEWHAKTKEGRLFWAEVNMRRATIADHDMLLVSVHDISQRKQAENLLQESEERFRSTFEQAAVGMAHVLPTGEFLRLNQKFCEIVGYPREKLMGMTFREITYPDDLEKDIGYVRQALAGEISTFTMEKRYVRKDRTRVWVSLTVSLLRKEDHTPDYFISVIEDITERKRAEQQLRDLSAHLQTVREEEKASIAREIHDDLGGTLTALKMDLYWLARKLPSDKEATPLLERAESMSLLLDNAVAVTRRIITELRPTILDDLGLLAAIEWQAAQFHKRTGIECRVNCPEDKGRLGKKPSITLFRILQEALTNVMRHSGATSVDVEFRHSDTAVSLRISDNGGGLPEKHVASPTSYGIRGMFERASSLGGHVAIESPPGGGLTVTVTLPCHNNILKEKS